jgi:hypothetical protein
MKPGVRRLLMNEVISETDLCESVGYNVNVTTRGDVM